MRALQFYLHRTCRTTCPVAGCPTPLLATQTYTPPLWRSASSIVKVWECSFCSPEIKFLVLEFVRFVCCFWNFVVFSYGMLENVVGSQCVLLCYFANSIFDDYLFGVVDWKWVYVLVGSMNSNYKLNMKARTFERITIIASSLP